MIRKSSNVRFRDEDFGGILLVRGTDYQLFGTDELGKHVWNVCDGKDLDELLDDPVIRLASIGQLLLYLADLRSVGAITWSEHTQDIIDRPDIRDFNNSPKLFPFSWIHGQTYRFSPVFDLNHPSGVATYHYAAGECSACSACSACGG